MILWAYIAAVAVIFAGTAVAWCWLQADTGCHAAERDIPGDLASLIRVTAVYAAIMLRARLVRTARPERTAPDHPLSGAVLLPDLGVLPALRARYAAAEAATRTDLPAVTGLTGEMPALTGGERL